MTWQRKMFVIDIIIAIAALVALCGIYGAISETVRYNNARKAMDSWEHYSKEQYVTIAKITEPSKFVKGQTVERIISTTSHCPRCKFKTDGNWERGFMTCPWCKLHTYIGLFDVYIDPDSPVQNLPAWSDPK